MKRNLKRNNFIQLIIIVAAACLVHGVMQGVHDNYGIMMNGLTLVTGIDYASIIGIYPTLGNQHVLSCCRCNSKFFNSQRQY